MSMKETKTWGSGGLFENRILGSLVLMLLTPISCITFWGACANFKGSFRLVIIELQQKGFWNFFVDLWPTPFDPIAWKIILSFMAFELILMRIVPGREFRATVTPSGHVPIYTANGFQCYLLSILSLFALSYADFFNPAIVYDHYGKILSSLNVFAICFCGFLAVKGLYLPSTKDSGTNGNVIIDYYWGTELYPRVFGWDVKQFTNSRFGMMGWQIAILCYALKQYEINGFVSSSMLISVILQSVYIAKFFFWETGYFCSMDIQHDRAGFYICWGCLVWVPSMYTIHSYYLVEHPVALSIPTTFFLIALGLLCVWVNYDCDRQRQQFRASCGKEKIWGQDPEYIVAEYATKDGEKRKSLLLLSGWWGLARHFHYVPEILAAFFWSVPGVIDHPLPYFYPVYLTLLLLDRAWRDDKRCSDKYKDSWELYCKRVPYRIFPGVV